MIELLTDHVRDAVRLVGGQTGAHHAADQRAEDARRGVLACHPLPPARAGRFEIGARDIADVEHGQRVATRTVP